MEPRPQSSRPAHGQPPPGAGRRPEEPAGYQPQPDPTTVVAPPRTDYDYSPLDLAPPGQRRRRQLVAAGLGGLVMLLLVGAIVLAVLALNDDDGDNGSDLAALQTQIAATETARQASTPETTTTPEETPDVAGAVEGAVPTTTAGGNEGQQSANPTPTPPPAVAGPTEAELAALLPSADLVPAGLEQQPDSSLSLAEVVSALGGSREAETNLTNWGWSGNAQRSFTAPSPETLAADATTDMTVSLHGFATDQAAAEALAFYSDILVNSGWQEVEVGDIGTQNRMLVQPQEDGGTAVALYVQQGPVLYRIGGYAPASDPSTNVINLTEAILNQ